MSTRKTVLFVLVAALVLAGCSKPGEQSSNTAASSTTPAVSNAVDYHDLIVGPWHGEKDPNYKAFVAAEMKCNESATPAEYDNNPWCAAVHKAKVCSTTVTIKGATGPQWAAYAKAHPTPECPPR